MMDEKLTTKTHVCISKKNIELLQEFICRHESALRTNTVRAKLKGKLFSENRCLIHSRVFGALPRCWKLEALVLAHKTIGLFTTAIQTKWCHFTVQSRFK